MYLSTALTATITVRCRNLYRRRRSQCPLFGAAAPAAANKQWFRSNFLQRWHHRFWGQMGAWHVQLFVFETPDDESPLTCLTLSGSLPWERRSIDTSMTYKKNWQWITIGTNTKPARPAGDLLHATSVFQFIVDNVTTRVFRACTVV